MQSFIRFIRAVFYDTNGDGVGDLPGVIKKLDYITSLGVDGVWLSPFFTSPMRDFGYDVSDYRNVDPIFGTLDDFDQLLKAAHKRGLKVIIDQVYSHTSDQHPWFIESRKDTKNNKADWYVWADAKKDGSPPNNWLSVFGGSAWTWDTYRQQYYLHNFLSEQPDLNFHNPAVQDAILDVARFWLDRGVDGFRLDVANYYFHDAKLRDNPPSGAKNPERPYHTQQHRFNRSRPETVGFVKKLRSVINQYPDRMSVAEIFSDHHISRSLDYTSGPDRLHTAYNFKFLNAESLTSDLIRAALTEWTDDTAWPSWSFSNHDMTRAISRWNKAGDDPAFAKLLVALLCSLRGTAFLYQGEELGLPQGDVPFEKLRDPEAIRFWPNGSGRDGARTPIPWESDKPNAGFSTGEPWLPVDARHPAMAVNQQDTYEGSVLKFTRRFFGISQRAPGFGFRRY